MRSGYAWQVSQRVKVAGRWINPNVPTHGVTTNGYCNYGCRCWGCTEAWAAYCKARTEQRIANRIYTDDGRGIAQGVEHGKQSTYYNHRCQCGPCLAASAKADKARKARKRTA